MKKTTFLLSAVAALIFVAQASADILTTDPNNNGLSGAGSGVYFDLTDLTGIGVTIEGFETSVFAAEGTTVNLDIWARSDSYVGNEGSNAGWVNLGGASGVVTAGTYGTFGNLVSFDIADYFLGASETNGFAFFTDFGIAYTGTGASPPTTTFSDGSLQLFGDAAATSSFSGVSFSPRTFSGSVFYSAAVPEPGSAAIILVGIAGLIARRKKV